MTTLLSSSSMAVTGRCDEEEDDDDVDVGQWRWMILRIGGEGGMEQKAATSLRENGDDDEVTADTTMMKYATGK